MNKIIHNGKSIEIGTSATHKCIATEDIVMRYAEISGDYNPIHIDDEYASKTVFGKRITHGLFCLGLISYLIGMVLPGEGSIFLDEELKYRAPVYINDIIEASVKIIGVFEEKKIIEIGILCVNQHNTVVLEGRTRIKMI